MPTPGVLGETHPLFRCERIDPGATLTLEGLFEDGAPRTLRVPPYRIALTSAWRAEEFRAETMRIHTLAVIPAAGVAAAIWRSAIGLSEGPRDRGGDRGAHRRGRGRRRPFHFLDISGAHVVPSASGDPALGHDPDEGLTIDSESFVLLLAEHLKVEHVLTKNCSIHLT